MNIMLSKKYNVIEFTYSGGNASDEYTEQSRIIATFDYIEDAQEFIVDECIADMHSDEKTAYEVKESFFPHTVEDLFS